MESLNDLLKKSPVFAALNPADHAMLAQTAIQRKFEKGRAVARYDDIWPYLFIIAEGSVNALKASSEGRNLIVATFAAGDIFWGLAFFDDSLPMPVTLETLESTCLFLWPRDSLLPLILQRGQLSWELSRLMVRRMLRASEIVEDLAFQPLTGRMARMLLDGFPASQDAVQRRLTLDEMAARIGSTREMVCRILYRFAEQGAIRINRTEFVFTDRSILEKHIR